MTEKLKKLTTSQGDNLLLLLILAIAVTLVSMKQANFFSLGTLESICYQLPEMGLLTMAMMVPMLSGGINLSMIASANLSGIVMALIMTENISKGEDNVGIVIGHHAGHDRYRRGCRRHSYQHPCRLNKRSHNCLF